MELLSYNPQTGWFHWIKSGKIAGNVNDKGYVKIKIGGTLYPAHRLAWLYVYGHYAYVDHKDCKPWNNAIDNLREATTVQNMQNKRVYSNNELGAKGINYRDGMYVARIWVNGMQHYLGRFKTLEEATAARKAAEAKYFGEFANEN